MPEPIDYKSKYEQLESTIITAQFDSTFKQQGGKTPEGITTADNPAPSQIAKIALQNQLRLVGGVVGVVGADGELRPLAQAIADMKKSGGYQNLFEDSQPQTQPTIPPGTKTYSAEQARNGKASIDEIASGKAQVID